MNKIVDEYYDRATQSLDSKNYKIAENSIKIAISSLPKKLENNGQTPQCCRDQARKVAEVYRLGAQITSMNNNFTESLDLYKKYQYYRFLFSTSIHNQERIQLYSFRRFSEYTLSDLINGTINMCSPDLMNDPFDTPITIWAKKDHLYEYYSKINNITPQVAFTQRPDLKLYSGSFQYFRIRSFCKASDNSPLESILMWSHYADSHKGFCIKYNLSKHFIEETPNEDFSHMCIREIDYSNKPFNINKLDIDLKQAFTTKQIAWKYEQEIRLLSYNPNITSQFEQVQLDEDSYIEEIIFGLQCPTIYKKIIKSVLSKDQRIKFFEMKSDSSNLYKLIKKPI